MIFYCQTFTPPSILKLRNTNMKLSSITISDMSVSVARLEGGVLGFAAKISAPQTRLKF